MRKILLLLIFTGIYELQAQNIEYGLKGGVNMSSFVENFDTPVDNKYKLGFQLGGYAKFSLLEKLYLQPELLYSLQGTRFDLDISQVTLPQSDSDSLFPEGSSKGNQQESNIILPVMLQYYFTEKFNIEFGPQLDFLFHTKSDELRTTNSGIVSEKRNYNESDFNFGLNVGVGYSFTEKVGVGFRYNYGFNRLEGASFDNKSSSKSRNSIFSFNFEYRLN